MKRKLFLTGPIGCGKSTATLTAIGEKLPAFGGFLTKRFRDEDGQAIAFSLESPNGKQKAEFLDCRGLVPAIHMDVFETMAPELLKGKYLILDEIGGLELPCLYGCVGYFIGTPYSNHWRCKRRRACWRYDPKAGADKGI